MTFLSLTFHRSERAAPCQPCAGTLEACHFKRLIFPGRAQVGGLLTWLPRDGHERHIVVTMTWDVLADLRIELADNDVHLPDDLIVRAVLCQWGLQQYRDRVEAGECLPAEGLVLDCVGGPSRCRARRLLQLSGLLPLEVAEAALTAAR
jgi:hypothetical protein